MLINPDHYLETKSGRVWTPTLNSIAWNLCYADLLRALQENKNINDVYLLIGCQGSGKSTWADHHHSQYPQDIIFDAILVKKSERKPIIDIATRYHKSCIGVWFQTPLAICLKRNAVRSKDKIADVTALENVFHALEAPQITEGFSKIINIK